jgi:hypothetical protein
LRAIERHRIKGGINAVSERLQHGANFLYRKRNF